MNLMMKSLILAAGILVAVLIAAFVAIRFLH